MESLLGDLRLTVRQLLRQRSFTLAAVLTLALAIGATTAIYSVVSGVLLRPLPFPEPSQLITICERHASVEGFCIASPPDVEDWRAASATVSEIGIARDWTYRLTVGDGTQAVYSGVATGGFFSALGLRPALGRLFRADEYGPAGRVVVLSDALWRMRFGGDSAAVGRTVLLDGDPATVVGVLPATADVPHLEGIQLWASLPFDPRNEENRAWRGFRTVARLAPGVTPDAAAAELSTIARRLGELHPATNAEWGIDVIGLRESLVGSVRRRLLVFLGAIGLVLLLGCVNLANLMSARAARREHELAVRAAIGAGRGRLTSLLLLESLVIAGAGTALGLLLASWGVDLFRGIAPPGIPRLDDVSIDWRVLLFALGLTGLTALIIGGAPALRGAKADLTRPLHGSRVARVGTRGVLVATETAIAVTLLVGAGLLGRTFAHLTEWNPGFPRDGLLVAWTGVSSGTYKDVTAVRGVYREALEAVRTIPGVEAVTLTSGGPLFGGEEPGMARAFGPTTDSTVVLWRNVGPAYFATLGLPLRSGRDFTEADRAGAPLVAIVNESAARRLWPGRPAVGERFVMTRDQHEFEVIGVVADIPSFQPDAPVRPEVYWPYFQLSRWGAFFVVRTEGDPPALARAIRTRLGEITPEIEPSRVQSLNALVDRRLVSPRFNAVLLGSFASVALLLAAIGIAGLVAYRVSHRIRETGIRLALGATGGEVIRQFMRESAALVGTGVFLGLVGAGALTRLLGSMLAGTSPTDPLTLATVAAAMLAIGFGAAWLPARRASLVDPIEALRAE